MEDEGSKTEVAGAKGPHVELDSTRMPNYIGEDPYLDHAQDSSSGTKDLKHSHEDLVNSASVTTGRKAQVEGKRLYEGCVENPRSATTTVASDIQALMDLGWTRLPNPIVEGPYMDLSQETDDEMDEDELVEVEVIDDDFDMNYGGYIYRSGGQLQFIGERPKPVKVKIGRPHPNAITYGRLKRRMAETGRGFLRGDPLGVVPWRLFAIPIGSSPTDPTSAASASDSGVQLDPIEVDLQLKMDLGLPKEG